MFSKRGRALRALPGAALLATLSLLLNACGDGSGADVAPIANDSGCSDCGTVFVSMTDAEGDLLSYSLDVHSIALRRADGGSVELLPATTRVDFAQLVDFSELVSVTDVAAGDFEGGSIRVDYSTAEVFVEAGGEMVQADVVGADGAPLGIVDLEIDLANREHLVVTRGRAALLEIDFDLDASHTVDTAASPARVIAEPYIVAEVRPVDEKEIRLRGALTGVQLDAGTYTIRVRPWHDRVGDHGEVTVHTTSSTLFEVGDHMAEGQAGLELLSRLSPGALTVAFGTLDVENRQFTAQIVHAGRSVGGQDIDAVYGHVIARTGDQLLVKGAFAVRPDRVARFHRTVVVEVGPNTTVFRTDRDQLLDKDAISIGQRIIAFGEFLNRDVQPADPTAAEIGPDVLPILDATEGRVRMLVTRLHLKVTSVMPGLVIGEVRGFGRLGVEHFDFSGIASDPMSYQVATSTLSLDALEVDRWAQFRGFVNPINMTPPDFVAGTVIDHNSVRAALGVGWSSTGTTAPFLMMDREALVVDLDNPAIDERHHIKLGLRVIDLFDLPASPPIVAVDPARPSLYGIYEPGHVELFKDFGEYIDAINRYLNLGYAARSMAAYGRYEIGTNTLTAYKMGIHMLPPEE